jgi:hypothetical protein
MNSFLHSGLSVSHSPIGILVFLVLFIDVPGVATALTQPIRFADVYVLAPVLAAFHLYTFVLLLWRNANEQASRLFFTIFGVIGFFVYGAAIQKGLSVGLDRPPLVWVTGVVLYVAGGWWQARWFWREFSNGRDGSSYKVWPLVVGISILILTELLLRSLDLPKPWLHWIVSLHLGMLLLLFAWVLLLIATMSWTRYRMEPVYRQQLEEEAAVRQLRKLENRKKRRKHRR